MADTNPAEIVVQKVATITTGAPPGKLAVSDWKAQAIASLWQLATVMILAGITRAQGNWQHFDYGAYATLAAVVIPSVLGILYKLMTNTTQTVVPPELDPAKVEDVATAFAKMVPRGAAAAEYPGLGHGEPPSQTR